MPRRREFGVADQLLGLVIVILVSTVLLKRWWRARALKQAEIRKLLILAAKEAAIAEAESLADYSSCSYSVQTQHCAVCFSPTATRCSRCKAVRYCSAKCQIVHWRQGHKYECKPPEGDDSDASLSNAQDSKGDDNLLDAFSQSKSIWSNEFEEERAKETVSATIKSDGDTNNLNPCNNVDSWDQVENKRPYHLEPIASKGFVSRGISEDKRKNFKSDTISSGDLHSTEELPPASPKNSIPGLSQSQNGVANSFATIQKEYATGNFNSFSSNSGASENLQLESLQIDKKPQDDSSSLSLSNTKHFIWDSQCDVDLGSSSRSDNDFHDLESKGSDICHPSHERSMPREVNGSSVRKDNGELQANLETAFESLNGKHDIEDASASGSQPSKEFSVPLDMPFSSDIYIAKDQRTSTDNANTAAMDAGNDSSGLESKVHAPSTIQKPQLSKAPSSRVSKVTNDPSSSRESKVMGHASRSSESKVTNDTTTTGKSKATKDNNASFLSTLPQSFQCNDSSNAKLPANADSAKLADSNGGRSKSSRTFSQHSAAQKEKTLRPCSRRTGSFDTISSGALQSVVSSLPSGNMLKASVKRVAQQLKPSKVSKQISTKLLNENAGKDIKILFPYELFVKLFTWEKFDIIPCGLINCGNSCYANAVLQCLIFTRPISAYLLQGVHSRNCEKKDWCFMCELERLIARMREGRGPISPVRILSKIENIGHHLGFGREEDAHEFLRFAIDTMQSVCLSEASKERVVDPVIQETTFVQQTFCGYLLSRIKCLKCQHVSERYEKMMDLTVEIEGSIESLQDALGRFTAPELLDGLNKYHCDRCKSYVKARKQLAIHEAPNILTIALKRFQSGKFGKLNKRVIFPEVLNLKPYMSGTGDKPPSYKLYAVVVHLDMMNASFSGHYVCYVKHPQGYWYKMDDSKVKQVDIDRVLDQGAYMLLYSRSSPRPPVLPRNGIVASQSDVVTFSKAAKQPMLNNGHERYSVPGNGYSSSASHRFGPDNHRAPFFASRPAGRDHMDWTSSDSGSLFSFSDEASCSTESNRDSTSTDEFAEAAFGDAGHMVHSTSGSSEDPYRASKLRCCLKATPSYQTEYFLDDNTFFVDSNLTEYHENRNSGPESCSPDSLINNTRNFFFPSVVQPRYIETDSLYSDRRSDQLDIRKNDPVSSVEPLQIPHSAVAPDILSRGSTVSNADFADCRQSTYQNDVSISAFFGESGKVSFDAPRKSTNTPISDYYFVQDHRNVGTLPTVEPDR